MAFVATRVTLGTDEIFFISSICSAPESRTSFLKTLSEALFLVVTTANDLAFVSQFHRNLQLLFLRHETFNEMIEKLLRFTMGLLLLFGFFHRISECSVDIEQLFVYSKTKVSNPPD